MERKAPKKTYKKGASYKKKSNAKSRNARTGKVRPAVAAALPVIHLSPAVEAYTHALGNCAEAQPCGMPIGGLPSEKNKCWVRGTMATGTSGAGYIIVAPANMMANTGAAFYNTTSAWVKTSMSFAPGTGVVTATSNSPYSLAAFNSANGVKGRLVGCEVRVRYIGTELNRGGEAIVYCEPNHNSLTATPYTDVDLLANAAAGRAPITMTDWISCKYQGVVDPTEETFTAAPNNPTITKNANACMCIWINSAVAGQPFDFEIYAIFESIGAVIAGTATTTMVDAVGSAAANSAASQAQIEAPGDHGSHEFFSRFAEGVVTQVSSGTSGTRTAAGPAEVATAQSMAHEAIMKTIAPKTSSWSKLVHGAGQLIHNPTFRSVAKDVMLAVL